MATNPGAIGAVESNYATNLGFGFNGTSRGIAAVQNASGDFTQPQPLSVTSALTYASQHSDGTYQLNFNGKGANVYNPSFASYLITKTTGWDPAYGAVMSAFINYSLTLGQEEAPAFGYGSLGLPLEQGGLTKAAADIPGAVPLTSAEQQAYDCGDLTQAEVEAGASLPSCNIVGDSAVSLITDAPNGPFSSGQTIEVKVASNVTFASGIGLYIVECSATGGIPTSPSQCDGKTYQHSPIFAGSDGSFDYPGYPVYSLPNAGTLGESGRTGPACDPTDECVLYVGENPNSFSLPHVWSQGFFVHTTAGDNGADPGNGLPEVPFVLVLPLIAVGSFGGTMWFRRRRSLARRY